MVSDMGNYHIHAWCAVVAIPAILAQPVDEDVTAYIADNTGRAKARMKVERTYMDAAAFHS